MFVMYLGEVLPVIGENYLVLIDAMLRRAEDNVIILVGSVNVQRDLAG